MSVNRAKLIQDNHKEIVKILERVEDKYLENGYLNDAIGADTYGLSISLTVDEDEDPESVLCKVNITSDETPLSIDAETLEEIADTVSANAEEALAQFFEARGVDSISFFAIGLVDGGEVFSGDDNDN